jgi:hypothetical protein
LFEVGEQQAAVDTSFGNQEVVENVLNCAKY